MGRIVFIDDAGPPSVLLAHFDGSDGSTTFTDEYGHTISALNAAALGTGQYKFGSASLCLMNSAASFGGATPADKLTASSHADFAIGTSDFCVELWVYRTAGVGNNFITFASQNWNIYYDNSANSLRFWDGGATRITGDSTLANVTWYHVALTRSGTSVRLFINGTQTGSTYTDSGPTNLGQAAILLGHYPASGSYHQGYMRSVRVTVGAARYTSNFTAPSAPFPENGTDDANYANVKLLLQFNGAAGSTTFTDVKGHTVTPSGSAMAIQWPGIVMPYGKYAVATSHADFAFGIGDFTVEMFVRREAALNASLLTFASQNWNIYYDNSANSLRFWDGSTDRIIGGAMSTATWYHIALTRASGVVRLFIDGTQTGINWTDSGPTNLGQADVLIGAYPNGSKCEAYIDELRLTKGLARYTSNFTAPSSAFVI